MLFFRSFIFAIYFYLWTGFSCIVMIPFLFTKAKTCTFSGRFWATGVIFGLKVICNIDYEERGREFLPQDQGFIIASKHQSAWDTIIFLKLFPQTCYILKAELLKLPLFGSYLKALEMIAVDRKGGSKALKSMLKQTSERLKEKRQIILFPEGTRTMPGEKTSYQPGIALIYHEHRDTTIIPAALNSGLFWPKHKFLKHPGTVVIEYLKPLSSELTKQEFMLQLSSVIEEKTSELMKS